MGAWLSGREGWDWDWDWSSGARKSPVVPARVEMIARAEKKKCESFEFEYFKLLIKRGRFEAPEKPRKEIRLKGLFLRSSSLLRESLGSVGPSGPSFSYPNCGGAVGSSGTNRQSANVGLRPGWEDNFCKGESSLPLRERSGWGIGLSFSSLRVSSSARHIGQGWMVPTKGHSQWSAFCRAHGEGSRRVHRAE